MAGGRHCEPPAARGRRVGSHDRRRCVVQGPFSIGWIPGGRLVQGLVEDVVRPAEGPPQGGRGSHPRRRLHHAPRWTRRPTTAGGARRPRMRQNSPGYPPTNFERGSDRVTVKMTPCPTTGGSGASRPPWTCLVSKSRTGCAGVAWLVNWGRRCGCGSIRRPLLPTVVPSRDLVCLITVHVDSLYVHQVVSWMLEGGGHIGLFEVSVSRVPSHY
jgi:hypothetical protein